MKLHRHDVIPMHCGDDIAAVAAACERQVGSAFEVKRVIEIKTVLLLNLVD